MKIQPILSSSKGNATRITANSGNGDILVDAGGSWKSITDGIGDKKYKPDIIFITHDHSDHISGAGVAGRKTGAPIHILQKCEEAIVGKKKTFFKNCSVTHYEPGKEIIVGDLKIVPFSVRHDSADICCLTVEDKGIDKKFGLLTDTGIITPLIKYHLGTCDAISVEMDYDEIDLLNYDGYDPFLKRRISSNWGHMSNQQALEFVKESGLDKYQFILCLHLSENTNSPERVMERITEEFGDTSKFIIAPQTSPIELK